MLHGIVWSDGTLLTHWMINTFLENSINDTIVEEHMPTKTMRFRKLDIPYMTRTPKWKNAIKLKRNYAKQYANCRTNENWELKAKWRKIQTTSYPGILGKENTRS